jgi:hypothetical protein
MVFIVLGAAKDAEDYSEIDSKHKLHLIQQSICQFGPGGKRNRQASTTKESSGQQKFAWCKAHGA